MQAGSDALRGHMAAVLGPCEGNDPRKDCGVGWFLTVLEDFWRDDDRLMEDICQLKAHW